MDDFKQLYETACQVGEGHVELMVKQANTIRRMRGAIWQALMQLKRGRADMARRTLEQQIERGDP